MTSPFIITPSCSVFNPQILALSVLKLKAIESCADSSAPCLKTGSWEYSPMLSLIPFAQTMFVLLFISIYPAVKSISL